MILKVSLTINFFSLSFMKEVTKRQGGTEIPHRTLGPGSNSVQSFHVLFSGTIFGFRLAFPVDISGTTELGGKLARTKVPCIIR